MGDDCVKLSQITGDQRGDVMREGDPKAVREMLSRVPELRKFPENLEEVFWALSMWITCRGLPQK